MTTSTQTRTSQSINSQSLILQAISDGLFGAFTSPPAGAPVPSGGLDATKVYLSLNWPGSQIDISDFANPWSPNNPNGNMAANENLSIMVDKAPNVHPIYSPSGQLVSDVYGLVTSAHYVPPALDANEKKAYDQALHFLSKKAQQTSYDDNGSPVTVTVDADSDVYANYKAKKKLYDNALTTMLAKYLAYDMADPKDQRQWSLLGPPLISAVQTAQQDLGAAQQTRVLDMLATLQTSSKNQIGQLFTAAQQNFKLIQAASLRNPGKVYSPSYAFPANWFAPNAANDWTEMTISSGSVKTSEHSDFQKTGVEAQASWGLWSVGGGFDKEDSHVSTSKDTSDLSVSFKFVRVDIVRPWLNFLLFAVAGWDLTGQNIGSLSNGGPKSALTGTFPLLATSFIAARNVRISAKWTHEDSSLITSKLSAKASFGWGPFSISGSHSQGKSDKTFNSEFDGTTITNNGLQILGWISSVVPNSPPNKA